MTRIEAHTVRPGMVLDSAGGLRVSDVTTIWRFLPEQSVTHITGKTSNGQGESRTVTKRNESLVQVKESR